MDKTASMWDVDEMAEADRRRADRHETKTCANCGDGFEAGRDDGDFCCDKCFNEYWHGKNASVKTGYVSPPKGQLSLTVIRDAHPTVVMTLDLGIPNFTVFSLKYPLVDDEKRAMSELTAEALNVLNDDVITFMLSMGYAEEVCVQICATVLTCFKNFSPKNDTQADLPLVGHDDSIVTYEGEFVMPQIFVDETYDKVVTAATIIKRLPVSRHLELTHVPPTKNTMSDAARAVKLFRGVSLTSQPQPLYVMVYDQKGRSRGVLPMSPGFKNQVLQNLRKR